MYCIVLVLMYLLALWRQLYVVLEGHRWTNGYSTVCKAADKLTNGHLQRLLKTVHSWLYVVSKSILNCCDDMLI